MNVLSIIGACGGTGATTLAAHLATSLNQQGRRTLAIDFSPFNTLRLHFGAPWEDPSGLAPQLLAGKPWNEAAWRSASGVDFIPYGTLDNDTEHCRFDALFDGQDSAHWFSNGLHSLDTPDDTWIVNDTPFPLTPLRAQVIAASTLLLVVLAPDASAISNTAKLASRLHRIGTGSLFFVLNGYDVARDLDHDVRYLFRSQLGNALAPVIVHRDESLREALASKQTVFDYAPSSQAAEDMSRLAFWLSGQQNASLQVERP